MADYPGSERGKVLGDQKRSSDYRATAHVDVQLPQGKLPEELMKINDAMITARCAIIRARSVR